MSNLNELDVLIQSTEPIIPSLSPNDMEMTISNFIQQYDHQGLDDYLQKINTLDDKSLLSRIFLRYCVESNDEIFKVLLNYQLVDVNYTDDINLKSCQHELCIHGLSARFELIAEKSKRDVIDLYGRTSLHYACLHEHSSIVRYLLSLGYSVDAIDHDGNTPLVLAVTTGNYEITKLLVEYKASVNAVTPHAPIPVCIACDHGYQDIVSLILEQGGKIVPTAEGMYPLHLACRSGQEDIVRLLVKHGANIEEKDSFYGWSPIFFAAQEGHIGCIEALLPQAIVNEPDQEGWIPLTYALYHGHIKASQILLPHSMPLVEAAKKPLAPASLFSHPMKVDIGMDVDLDDIPSLSLPPPIIPLRI